MTEHDLPPSMLLQLALQRVDFIVTTDLIDVGDETARRKGNPYAKRKINMGDAKDYAKWAAYHLRAAWEALEKMEAELAQLRAITSAEPETVTYKEVADTMHSLWGGTLKQVQIAQEMAGKKLYVAPVQGPSAACVPFGFRLVPVEPTIEMIAALGFGGEVDLAIGHGAISKGIEEAYVAMLAVAPDPATVKAVAKVESPVQTEPPVVEPAATSSLPSEQLSPGGAQPGPEWNDRFEAWWEDDGQFCLAGGGDCEKTFAFRAWEACLADAAGSQSARATTSNESQKGGAA